MVVPLLAKHPERRSELWGCPPRFVKETRTPCLGGVHVLRTKTPPCARRNVRFDTSLPDSDEDDAEEEQEVPGPPGGAGAGEREVLSASTRANVAKKLKGRLKDAEGLANQLGASFFGFVIEQTGDASIVKNEMFASKRMMKFPSTVDKQL